MIEGEEIKLERFKVTVDKQALEAKLQHDGIEIDNVNWFKEKVAKWADEVKTG